MKWISKEPPLYAWHGHTWYNERDKEIYTCDTKKHVWVGLQVIPFPKKTKIMS